MVLSIVTEIVEGLVGAIVLAAFVVLGYYAYQKLAQIRNPTTDVDDIYTGAADIPIELQDDERILLDSRGRDLTWQTLLIVGLIITVVSIVSVIFIFFIYWGIAIMVYANDWRTSPDFIFTTERVLKLKSGIVTETYDYDNVQQLQVGKKGYERLFRVGHLKFSLGDTHELHRLSGIRDTTEVAKRLENET